MGYDWKSSGAIPIKQGITLETLVNAFYDLYDVEERYRPEDVLPQGGYQLVDDIDFTYDQEGGELSYSVDSNSSHLDGVWSDYLDAIAENYAAAGWENYPAGDDEPDFMGPTPEAIKSAKIAHYLGVIEHAMAAIEGEL